MKSMEKMMERCSELMQKPLTSEEMVLRPIHLKREIPQGFLLIKLKELHKKMNLLSKC